MKQQKLIFVREVGAIIEGAGPGKEVLEISEDIFNECLINSLSHRDYYEKGAVTHVEIFDDRVDVTNPGGLVQSIAKEEFWTKSFSRNPLVFGLFLRMNMVEKIGSGINRMKEEMRLANLPEPNFRFVGFFTASFLRPVAFSNWINNWGDRLNTSLIKILYAIYDNPSVTKVELSNVISQGKTSVDNHINTLKKLGLIKRAGSRKTGIWKIIQLPNSGQ